MKYQNFFEHFLGPIKSQIKINVRCPFHDDKNPSLSINLEKGLFNCFACDGISGWTGDFFALMTYNKKFSELNRSQKREFFLLKRDLV